MAINSARVAFPPMRPLLENGCSDRDAFLNVEHSMHVLDALGPVSNGYALKIEQHGGYK